MLQSLVVVSPEAADLTKLGGQRNPMETYMIGLSGHLLGGGPALLVAPPVLAAIQVAVGILVALGVLALIGLVAIIYFAWKWFIADNEPTISVDLALVSIPDASTPIGPAGVDYSAQVTGVITGTTTQVNLVGQQVTFRATTDSVTQKTPPDGKVATGSDGIAKCNFTGTADGSTSIEASTTIEGKTITKTTPTPYETTRY